MIRTFRSCFFVFGLLMLLSGESFSEEGQSPNLVIFLADLFKSAGYATDAFDPPLWDKSKERVEKSHYFVKDFKPLDLGVLTLKGGRHQLTLTAPGITGDRAIDLYSIVLDRVESNRK